jgi:hypothetical protein
VVQVGQVQTGGPIQKIIKVKRTGGVAEVVVLLPNKFKALISNIILSLAS